MEIEEFLLFFHSTQHLLSEILNPEEERNYNLEEWKLNERVIAITLGWKNKHFHLRAYLNTDKNIQRDRFYLSDVVDYVWNETHPDFIKEFETREAECVVTTANFKDIPCLGVWVYINYEYIHKRAVAERING